MYPVSLNKIRVPVSYVYPREAGTVQVRLSAIQLCDPLNLITFDSSCTVANTTGTNNTVHYNDMNRSINTTVQLLILFLFNLDKKTADGVACVL